MEAEPSTSLQLTLVAVSALYATFSFFQIVLPSTNEYIDDHGSNNNNNKDKDKKFCFLRFLFAAHSLCSLGFLCVAAIEYNNNNCM